MQVGMLHALYERGIVPDLLVATSVGALNAAFVASRPQTVATARELGRVWRNLAARGHLPSQHERAGRRLLRAGGTTWSRIAGCASSCADTSSSKSLPAPPSRCTCVAFELIEGRELLLSDGPAVRFHHRRRRDSRRVPAGPDRRALVERRWRGQQHADLTRARARGREDLRAPDSAPGQPASPASAQCARHRHVRAWIAERHSASKRHRSVLGRG